MAEPTCKRSATAREPHSRRITCPFVAVIHFGRFGDVRLLSALFVALSKLPRITKCAPSGPRFFGFFFAINPPVIKAVPQWRNGQRASLGSSWPLGLMGSNPIRGTIYYGSL